MNTLSSIAAAAAWLALLGGCSQAPAPAPSTAPGARPLTLEDTAREYLTITTLAADGEPAEASLPGRVAYRPQGLTAAGSPLAGRVAAVLVRPGQAVQAGAPLLVVQSADAAAARASLDQAQARSRAAADMLRRQEDMQRRGVGLEVERVAAETALAEARAESLRAERGLALLGSLAGDRFTLRAPGDGVVLSVKASAGGIVSPGGEPLVEIGDPRQLWVVADVPEAQLAGLKPGSRAEVRIPSLAAAFGARVDGLGQVVDGEQRRLPVYLAIDTPAAAKAMSMAPTITPGMRAEVRVKLEGEARLRLPVAAVLIKDGSRRVVYVEGADRHFQPRTVRTGASQGGLVTVLEGLSPGDRVVTRGALLLDGEAEQLL